MDNTLARMLKSNPLRYTGKNSPHNFFQLSHEYSRPGGKDKQILLILKALETLYEYVRWLCWPNALTFHNAMRQSMVH